MILVPFWGPKSLRNWSKVEEESVLASRGRALTSSYRLGADLGEVWEAILESKSASEAILKAFSKQSLIWYPSEIDFGLILSGFGHLIGGQKEGVNSKETIIADPSKSLIFLRKITNFTT